MMIRTPTTPDRLPAWLSDIPENPVSRLAPTPSGYLHLGNAVNFLITWAIVRCLGGTLHLRIDDMDGIRFREAVLEDIFISLDWLGIDWDRGPFGPEAFRRGYSLQARKEYYREELRKLGKGGGRTFACGCSRKEIKKVSASGLYPGTCRDADLAFIAGRHAVRLKVDRDTPIGVDGRTIDLAEAFGDFVLWRKDNQPSYHLASLLEDEALGMTLIVRGEDLLLSTAAQIYLARCFGFSSFPGCFFYHHGLITGGDGEKLSKSRGAYALKDMRESGRGPEAAVQAAAGMLGLCSAGLNHARDLQSLLAEGLVR